MEGGCTPGTGKNLGGAAQTTCGTRTKGRKSRTIKRRTGSSCRITRGMVGEDSAAKTGG